MITKRKLLDRDFDKHEHLENVFTKGQYAFTLEDNMIKYIQEVENYEGITVQISDIQRLESFLKCLPLL